MTLSMLFNPCIADTDAKTHIRGIDSPFCCDFGGLLIFVASVIEPRWFAPLRKGLINGNLFPMERVAAALGESHRAQATRRLVRDFSFKRKRLKHFLNWSLKPKNSRKFSYGLLSLCKYE